MSRENYLLSRFIDCSVPVAGGRSWRWAKINCFRMHKPPFNPSYPTIPILILIVSSGLCLLAIGVSNISTVREALATGQTYSAAIIFDDKTMIYRSESPVAYWRMIGLIAFSCAAGIGLGTSMSILVIVAYTKKLARMKREKSSPL